MRRYCCILAFICSVWSSICWWNVVVIRLSIPNRLETRPQQVDVNWGPRSKSIVLGKPWRHTTSRRNNLVNPTASIVVWQGIQCHIFESLSTTTECVSNPWHSGSPTAKSIEISFYGFSGSGKGRRTPNVANLQVLERWQLWQFRTYWSTCFRISFD